MPHYTFYAGKTASDIKGLYFLHFLYYNISWQTVNFKSPVPQCMKGGKYMRKRVHNMIHLIKTEFENRSSFLKNAKSEIAGSNIKFLMVANIAAVFFVIFFILITPYIITDWTPTHYHVVFVPVLILCCIITFILSEKHGTARLSRLCASFLR